MIKAKRNYSGTRDGSVSEREIKNRLIAREAATEGIVLLKNSDCVLPLKKGESVALFGSGALFTIAGGTGSGDVNKRDVVSIYDGLKSAGVGIVSSSWLEDYNTRYAQAREDWKNLILEKVKDNSASGFFAVYTSNPFQMPGGRPIAGSDVDGTQKAVYVISRVAGEAADRYNKEGDYDLSKAEKEELATLCSLCGSVIVLINSGAQIDLKFIESFEQVKSIVIVSQPGMEGGNAVADVLTGAVAPSGKLTDTWAINYEDFPNSATFSHNNGDVENEYYEEGIYVGYRYFDSFGKDVSYPFGHGLSYTEFDIVAGALASDGERIYLDTLVRNTGSLYTGKEVVQLYVSCPQQKTQKELKRLCSYAKTKLLAPGEEVAAKLSFPVKELASFDEAAGAWVIESGNYALWLGNSSRNVQLVGVVKVDEDTEIERVAHICPLQQELNEISRPDEIAACFEKDWNTLAKKLDIQSITIKPAPVTVDRYEDHPLMSVASGIVDVANDDQLADMVIGEQFTNPDVTKNDIGLSSKSVPGASAETSYVFNDKYNVAPVILADGPAGLRLKQKYEVDRDSGEILPSSSNGAIAGGIFATNKPNENADTYYQYCTAFPVGVMLAQTWNAELLEKVGVAVAVEMREFGISWWLAPGMNIHRNPLCGRNFEYFSEDPMVSGVSAAAITRGVQSMGGVGTTIKHYSCNNQEDNRRASDSVISERALREIYLKGFEIAVKSAQPMAIMTSYNLINGVHAANSRDLCTVAARDEWGFKGIIMTDWHTTSGGSRPATAHGCIMAGNDLIMPGVPSDKPDLMASLANGKLDREMLKLCVKRLITAVFQTSAYEDSVSYTEQFSNLKPYINS